MDEHDEALNQNSILFAIICNFPHFCGEERAKEARDYVQQKFKELAEYQKAEAEGRIIKLPCKVGDIIWDRYATKWEITQIDNYGNDRILIRCGLSGTSNYCALWLNRDEIYYTREAAEEALTK